MVLHLVVLLVIVGKGLKMLQPKRTKFRKLHKGRIRGFAKGGSDLNFGTYGLKATTPERVTADKSRPPDVL